MIKTIKNKFIYFYSLFKRALKYQIENGWYKAFKKIKLMLICYWEGPTNLSKFISPKGLDVKRSIKKKYNYSGELVNFFVKGKNPTNKWHHYIPLYEKHLSKYRDKDIKILEIGVGGGGSLQMWRNYFGHKATIFGIDCREEVAGCVSGAEIRIGDQSDENFLKNVAKEMKGIDVIIDDGSHNCDDIKKSLIILFPLLNDNGTYVIEDLHTTYFRRWGGGINKNFFDNLRALIDDMHQNYHEQKFNIKAVSKSLVGIHVYDSIIFLDKSKVFKPNYSIIPKYK